MRFRQLFQLLLEANPENRITFLYKKYNDKFKKLIDTASDFGYDTEDAFFRFIVMHIDPTHGEYSEWLVRQFAKMTTPQLDRALFEDYTTILYDLQTYHQFKKLLKNTSKYATWGDINQIPSLRDLRNAIDTLTPEIDEENEKLALKQAAKDAKKVYNSEKWLVVIPQTEQASCAYGARTRWCTAADTHNRFDYYNKQGPLYIFINKLDNKKFQFHFQSHQYMDETDSDIEVKEFVEANEELREFIIGIAKENGNTHYPCILNPTECVESCFKRLEEIGLMEKVGSEIKLKFFGGWSGLTTHFFDDENEKLADKIENGDYDYNIHIWEGNITPSDYYDWLDADSEELVRKYYKHNFNYDGDDDLEDLITTYPESANTIAVAIRMAYSFASEEAASADAQKKVEKALLYNMNAKNVEYMSSGDGFIFTMKDYFMRVFKLMVESSGHVDDIMNFQSSSVDESMIARNRKAWSLWLWSRYGEACQEYDSFREIGDIDYEPYKTENGETFNTTFQSELEAELGPPWEHREYLRLKKAGQLDLNLGLEQFNRYYITK